VKTSVFLSILILLIFSCEIGPNFGDKYAIVYGVSEYDSGVAAGVSPNLIGPQYDVAELSALYASQGFTVYSEVDASATKAAFLADLNSLSSQLEYNDLLVIHFSGHGARLEVNGYEEEYIFYFGSLDASTTDLNLAISPEELLAYLDIVNNAQVVMTIDTCNSGNFSSFNSGTDTLPDNYSNSFYTSYDDERPAFMQAWDEYANGGRNLANVTVISASGADELAYEWSSGSNLGVFTNYFLQSPSGADTDFDGYVTASEAYQYVYTAMEEGWNTIYENSLSDMLYLPHISGGATDPILFVAQ
jgi:hypothetical protein